MRDYKVRMFSKEEGPQLVEWLHANRAKNHYDPAILGCGATRVMAVDRGEETLCYLPLQTVIMSDSLAPNPRKSVLEIARAMKEFVWQMVRMAKQAGIGEIYFLCDPKDTATLNLAKRHGYEELGFKVMRLKPGMERPKLPEQETSH